MVLLGLIVAAAASIAFNVGVVLQAVDARRAPARDGLRLSLLAHLARHRRWIGGFLLGGVGVGLQVLALSWAPFVVVQPMLAAGLLLVLYLGVRMLGERVGGAEVAAVAAVIAGIGLLAWGTPAGTETPRSDAAVISVMATMTVVAGVPFFLRGRGRLDSATFVIVASALAFGASNIATKLVSEGLGAGSWSLVAVWVVAAAATGAIGLIAEMTALQRRPATLVVPLSFAVQTFLPVLLEPVYLSEHWGTAALDGTPLVAGLVLVGVGAIVVARTRAVAGLVASS